MVGRRWRAMSQVSCRRDSSPPIVSEARGGASFFLSLACARERSAGRRKVLIAFVNRLMVVAWPPATRAETVLASTIFQASAFWPNRLRNRAGLAPVQPGHLLRGED